MGLVDGCNVIVLLGISANRIDSEDRGRGEYILESIASIWWGITSQESDHWYQYEESKRLGQKNLIKRGGWALKETSRYLMKFTISILRL